MEGFSYWSWLMWAGFTEPYDGQGRTHVKGWPWDASIGMLKLDLQILTYRAGLDC